MESYVTSQIHHKKGELQVATRKKRKMMEERGKKGRETTAKRHDKEFYQEIGQKGGEVTAENHDQQKKSEKRWR